MISPSTTPLTLEEQAFTTRLSWGALLLGPIYSFANGFVIQGVLFIIPFYNVYLWLKGFFVGRRVSWEKGEWISFESYRKRQVLLDRVGIVWFVATIVIASLAIYAAFAALSGPWNSTRAFIDEVQNGQVQQAFDSASNEFKSIGPVENFQKYLDTATTIKSPITLHSASIENGEATVSGTASNGSTVTFSLVSESGSWKVSGFEIK